LRNLTRSFVVRNRKEECIHHRVWVSFAALAYVPAVRKSGVKKHFPDVRIPPIVRLGLGENLDSEIVVTAFQQLRAGESRVMAEAN